MNTKEEILNYIKSREFCGALLLTGEWGCGKSHLIKELAREVNVGDEISIGIISLFGIDNISMLNHCIKETYLLASNGFFTRTVRKAVKGVGQLIKSGAEVASVVDPSCGVSAGLAKGIGNVLSLNMFDYIPVKNEFGRGNKKRKFVLVFDDLERCKINIVDLLGTINDCCENKKIKTILIADESKLFIDENGESEPYLMDKRTEKKKEYTQEAQEKAKQYKEFKEKLIFQTIKLETNYGVIIDNIIKEYRETIVGSSYKEYLELKEGTIKQVFYESQYNNIRTVKKIIVAFERIFNFWPRELAFDYLESILYTFSADMYENVTGNLCRGKYDCITLRSDEIAKKYSRYGQNNSNITLLKEWILEGVWDNEKLKEHFFERFNPKEFSDKHKFLNWSMFDLDDTTLQRGYKEALKEAYNGDCASGRTYDWLIQRYENLKRNGLILQPELDYVKLELGLDRQIAKIKNGEIVGEWREFFVSLEDLKRAREDNPKHYKILKKIEYVSNALLLWSNQRELLDCLKSDAFNFYELSAKNRLEKLEKELCKVMLNNYKNKDNRGKTDFLDFFEKLILIDSYTNNPITQGRVDETLDNLTYLKEQINQLMNIDEGIITKLIHKRFMQLIDKDMENVRNMQTTSEE